MQSRSDVFMGFVCLLTLLFFSGCASTHEKDTPADPDPPKPLDIHDIVRLVSNKTAIVRTFTATVEMQALDPNGGFDKFHDELSFKCPDKISVKRTILAAHDSDAVGRKYTTAVDGTWLVALDESFERPYYSKVNLKAVEKAGGPTVEETLAFMGNLAAPFAIYKQETLKLESETPAQWVILAEFKQEGAPWVWNRITIDKKTGFLQTVEAQIPQMAPVVLLNVLSVTPNADVEDSVFTMAIPAMGANVVDNTSAWVESVRAQRSAPGGQGLR